ncbi:MAG: S8 family serine peptidase [Phycisphaerae bacterium]
MRQFSRVALLALVAGLAVPLVSSVAVAQPPAKTPVKTAADLPVHTYRIEGKASDFVLSDKPFREFAAKVKADLEADLAKFDIQDKPTLQGYYGILQQIAMFEGRHDEALSYVERIRGLELKEAKRLMTGQTLSAYVEAKKSGLEGDALKEAYAANLERNLSKLPWDVIREEVTAAKGRAEMISRELVIGQLKAGLDPVVEASKGELSSDMARGLVGMRVTMDVMLPLQPAAAGAYGKLLSKHAQAMRDNWTSTLVTLAGKEKASPVEVCVWDSGLDVAPFAGQLHVNAKETVNGKDDDGNGFVDDVNGIAFDLESRPTVDILHSVKELRSGLPLVESHTKGMMDVQANIDSPESSALKKYMAGLKADQVKDFMEDLGLYGNYSHGTHVAGIAAEGNPFARLLPCRITFDYKSIPQITPNEDASRRTAESYRRSVQYMKDAGVRVVNMSWGGSYKSIEEALEAKGVGKSPEERAELAKKLFAIEKEGLEGAIKSAPEILFIAAAGNSNNNNAFEQFIPSGLNLPNLITVGAVDKSGKPTGFTTFGENVRLYANGFEVDSYVPGGKRMKFSGTSMAAPNVTNLAAKLFALHPSLKPADVIDLLHKGGTPMEGHSELLVINGRRTVDLAASR